jgi:hypothetical protein
MDVVDVGNLAFQAGAIALNQLDTALKTAEVAHAWFGDEADVFTSLAPWKGVRGGGYRKIAQVFVLKEDDSLEIAKAIRTAGTIFKEEAANARLACWIPIYKAVKQRMSRAGLLAEARLSLENTGGNQRPPCHPGH